MPDNGALDRKRTRKVATELHFDVSTGLKRVLGRELITNDEVAIFEVVKNSFDAQADTVHLFFGPDNIVIADNGHGMSYEDLQTKWLFVAYSAKRQGDQEKDFRNVVAERQQYAGSKGIGRFSSDRLGELLVLQTREGSRKSSPVHRLAVNWEQFERNDKQHFENVPVDYSLEDGFEVPAELRKFVAGLSHGTIIELSKLRQTWDRGRLLALKSSLAKLINPFGSEADRFRIFITAPDELPQDQSVRQAASKQGNRPLPKDIVNGVVGNFIFSTLQEKTTFISVRIDDEKINTTLTDRGEVVYRIREPNPYSHLNSSGFSCEMYYLNQSAKHTFARRMGLPSVQFGSVFLFRNGFRVYPIGEDGDDWFAFDRRKQQGYARFLGTREIIGRIDVFGSDRDFQEASSRNQGLIETPAVRQLKKAVLDHCLRRLERYVVPVSWKDSVDAETEDLSRLLTDPGRARVTASIASLVDNENIELLQYSRKLVGLLNERSSEFENSLVDLKLIAEKTGDKALVSRLARAEKRFEELKKSEAAARKAAEVERSAAEQAEERALTAEATAEHERRRSDFLQSVVSIDASTILNLHHQVLIYAVDLAQQIENLLSETEGQDSVSREALLKALEQMAFLNKRVQAIARFAPRATFQLDSEQIQADLAKFVTEYIENIAKVVGSARTSVEVRNRHPGLPRRFNPIDVSVVIDNLINNARKARASSVIFTLEESDSHGLVMRVTDNGRGMSRGVDRERIFEMGYTATRGSGLGLYHVRQVLGEMGGSIELDESTDNGTTFLIKLGTNRKSK